MAALPVVVCGFGINGKLFSELTSTHDISRSGCSIHMSTQPQPASSLAIRLTPPEGTLAGDVIQILFQVAWLQPQGDGWTVGASVLDNTDLRTLAFPSFAP